MGLTLLRSGASTCDVQEVPWADQPGGLLWCFLPFSFPSLLPSRLLCSPLDTLMGYKGFWDTWNLLCCSLRDLDDAEAFTSASPSTGDRQTDRQTTD